jgi:hypothetical protein
VHVDATWKARVKTATGIALAPGTPCVVKGGFDRDAEGKTSAGVIAIVCGTKPLYSTEDRFNGMSNTSYGLMEDVGPEPNAHRLLLQWSDKGPRQGRAQASIDTSVGAATVWTEDPTPTKVELTVDELSDKYPEALLDHSKDGAACARTEAPARVTEVSGDAPLEAGAACDVTTKSINGQCRVRIKCGDVWLYGEGTSGYASVENGKARDTSPSVADRDPRLEFDLASGLIEVSDEGVTKWSVKLQRGEPKR